MPLEILLRIETMILRYAKERFELTKHDLLVMSCSKNGGETLYTLTTSYGLDRGMTSRRIKILEERDMICRSEVGRNKIISITKEGLLILEEIEKIKII